MRAEAPRNGLRTPFRGGTLRDIAVKVRGWLGHSLPLLPSRLSLPPFVFFPALTPSPCFLPSSQMLEISKGGLERRGMDESHFLKRLQEVVDTGRCQSDELLDLYNTRWQHQVDPVFDEYMF
jgi:hypothetical protein